MFINSERKMVRELARKYAEIASLDVQSETKKRMIENNGLIRGKPPVIISEIPWHEMDIDGELELHCSNEFLRDMESFFRKTLFQWRYFPGDMYVENVYPLSKSIHIGDIGIDAKEDIISMDQSNHIVSHNYHDQIKDYHDLEKIHIPEISRNMEQENRNFELVSEILEGILPVERRGVMIYYAPWDQIPRFRGVTEILMDMVDRPQFLHAIIDRFTEIGLHTIEQFEKLGVLEWNLPLLHCTPGLVSDLPQKDYDHGNPRLKDVWIRSMAQMFGSVSPEMHEEFDLQYSMKLFEKCGLVYYGCCEPLDNKIDMLKKIPNLRKVGVSPWADVRSSAEQLGKDYVYAHKPNPANVAIRTDKDVVEKEITDVIKACEENECAYEFVLKDISTVSYRPQNLIEWEKTVGETIQRFYG